MVEEKVILYNVLILTDIILFQRCFVHGLYLAKHKLQWYDSSVIPFWFAYFCVQYGGKITLDLIKMQNIEHNYDLV